MPLVTVLLAVHNGARYLDAAVRSVLTQTLRDLELLVVDDASTDDTARILDDVGDPRLLVLRNERQLGLAASLNHGLDSASGKYVARLDADDVALPSRLERQVAHLRAVSNLAVVGSAVADLDEHGRTGRRHRMPRGDRALRWHALFSSPFFHPTVVVDRELLDRHELRYDPSYLESEDYDLWTRVFRVAAGANLRDVLVHKRVHPGQASLRRSELQQSLQRRIALREIARLAPGLGELRAEQAWLLGSGRGGRLPEARDALRELLAAFEGEHGLDLDVRAAVARTLLRARLPRRRRPAAPLTRVAVVSPEPTPYRAPLFDRIGREPGLDVTVIYAAPSVAGREWAVRPAHRSVVLRGRSIPGAKLALRHDYPVTPGILRALRRANPDVVVVSGWSTFAAQAALAWCRLRRVPYVLLVESHDLERRSSWRRLIKGTVVPPLVRGAANVLAVGSAAADSVRSHGATSVRTFANTIDVDRWTARAHALERRRDEDAVVVLSAARLVPEKGLDDLVRAVAGAGDRRLRLVVAGDGPERRRLGDLASELGVTLTLVGNVGEDELAQLYVDADIFALLSRHEPWGVVVNEAAASGLPLVLSDRVGAAHDLLREEENGFMVRSGDVAAAAAALRRLAGDAELRRRFGERSHALVRGWGYEPSVAGFVAAVREATAR